MRTSYDRLEIGVGTAGILVAALLSATVPGSRAVAWMDVFRWSGALLLAQGFLRDVVILLRRRRGDTAEEGPEKRGWWICVESTVGLLLIGQAGLLVLAGGSGALRLPLGGWAFLLSMWWLFGYATRELVLKLKRDPDHVNLLIGFRGPPIPAETGWSATPTRRAPPAAEAAARAAQAGPLE